MVLKEKINKVLKSKKEGTMLLEEQNKFMSLL